MMSQVLQSSSVASTSGATGSNGTMMGMMEMIQHQQLQQNNQQNCGTRMQTTQLSPKETKIVYYLDDEDTPYSVRVPIPPQDVTLRDFKNLLSLPKNNYKFFFKSPDDEFGIVKEEVIEDDAKLPIFKGRIVSYIMSAEDESNSSMSQVSWRQQSTSVAKNGAQQNKNNGTNGSLRQLHNPHRNHPPHHPNHPHHHYMSCDDETSTSVTSTSYTCSSCMDSDDSDDDDETAADYETISGVSITTDDTSVSRVAERRHRNRMNRGRHLHHPILSDDATSSISSMSGSSVTLKTMTVILNMDGVNFLGIATAGHPTQGIFVSRIMPGGAVALDGRIEKGDMILQVNDVNFQNITNDEAVQFLRDALEKPGPIKIVIVKMWDSNPKGYLNIPRSEPVRPIDPGAWVAHTEAARASAEQLLRPPSVGSSSNLSGNSSLENSSTILINGDHGLHHDSGLISGDLDYLTMARLMSQPDSGLEIKDRNWLKITIPNAFLGSDAIEWLMTRVEGLNDRKMAKKYCSELLKEQLIRHTISTKSSFTEQCYYVFSEVVTCDPL